MPIAVVGLGRIGALHATNLATNIPRAALAMVADVRGSVAQQFGARLDVPWSSSPEDTIEDDRVKAVVIATPTSTHASLVEHAARAGKHIFCEKPVTLDIKSTTAAMAATQAAGVVLQVGFQIRYDPQFARLRSQVRQGALGETVLFQAKLRDMRPPNPDYLRGCGGLLLDGGTHLLDLALWMVGDIRQVTAVGTALSPVADLTRDVDRTAVILRFDNGALGILENCRSCGYGFECAAEVVGSKRTARIGDRHIPQLEWLEAGARSIELVDDFVARFSDAYRAELAGFADAVRTGRPFGPSGADAVAVARLADAAGVSLREARMIDVDARPSFPAARPTQSSTDERSGADRP